MKMNRHLCLYILWICSQLLSHKVYGDVRLPKMFSDNMVVQRDKPIKVWGWAAPGEKVSVSFATTSVSAKADHAGKWSVALPAVKAGGPFELIIKGKNNLRLVNILAGDVWVCSGQSNMQWNISQTGYQEMDTTFVRKGKVRLFNVPVDTDYVPREDITGGEWKVLSIGNINSFSAVAYHFGKYLYEELEVPIGLISSNLGATAIETWMSNESLMQFPQFQPMVEPLIRQGKSFAQLQSDFEKIKPQWYQKYYYKGAGIEEHWYDPAFSVSDWKPIKVSGNTWETEPELKDHDGEVWFRTIFDLPDNFQGENFPFYLGQIDDYDIAWVNGVKIGETFGKHNHRNYKVPVKSLKPKGNVLVVRVVDAGGIGGFTTSSFWGNAILWGDWVYRKGFVINPADFPQPNLPNATPFSSPGVLYNAMIAPLTKFPIKGAIWYQGESNADRAYEYRELLPAMISEWRRQWGQGNFPFLFVQLANHYEESPIPVESNWAELREAQAMALTLPNTGMATAIDLGEANDIHPKNKLDVGKRLGIAAMKVAHQKDVVATGPTFGKMLKEGDALIIEFNNTGGGLISKNKHGYIHGFQVAGNDQKFYWAKAHISGNTVVVKSDQVSEPVAVRYAWDNNPGQLDLYNKEGLPANPFRTDSWKGITAGKTFVEGPRF
jgi:sialate O-acetylesterase